MFIIKYKWESILNSYCYFFICLLHNLNENLLFCFFLVYFFLRLLIMMLTTLISFHLNVTHILRFSQIKVNNEK